MKCNADENNSDYLHYSRFTPANHLLPTLFDRLCDNAPYQKIDRDISVTPVQLKEIIR
ncbi:hypothetical protein MJM45_29065, partial [Salmonella enterica subsp. enterica serovar Kentucky]|nr:hypothetical protein [Salmonella enterica subsp. enterica serovar Kentucky]